MNNQDQKIPLKEIIKVFNQINAKEIISLAKKIQKKLLTDKNLIIKSNKNEYKIVTKADIEIQKNILDYFANSSLKNTYNVIAEEKIKNKVINENASWYLIIDPLDGTSSFKKQSKIWGVMVGACDNNGILRYSWNLLSTGEIFTSGCKKTSRLSFQNKINSGNTISIDIYNYSSSLLNKFKDVFINNFGINDNQIIQTSYPAAIWAGYKLFKGNLDGLLWLPNNKGKKFYPEYDLVFLGALLNKGYNVIIGKAGLKNNMISVAATIEDAEKLYKVGIKLIPADKRLKLNKFINELRILN